MATEMIFSITYFIIPGQCTTANSGTSCTATTFAIIMLIAIVFGR